MNAPLHDVDFLARLLSVIEQDILPLTANGVTRGNKVFGAALLHKSSRDLLLAETNNERLSPLHHGEMYTLKKFYELPANERPGTGSLIFLTTHEPCSLCLSAITWCGFDNFYYFFSHEDSRDSFAIPHDLKILKEVFDLDPGAYRKRNAFWQGHGIRNLIKEIDEPDRSVLSRQAERICHRYEELSATYQASKDQNDIPLN